jgi:hypothetical protein
MTNTTIPPEAQLSPEEQARNDLAQRFMPLLRSLVRTAEALYCTNDSLVLFCIEIDAHWKELANMLMPGNEAIWETERASGRKPLAIGLAPFELCTILAKIFPPIANVILETPKPEVWKAVILDDDGITVINIPSIQKKKRIN